MLRLATTITALTFACASGPVAGMQTDGLDPVIVEQSSQAMRDRLAATLVRYAREVFGTEPLSVEGLTSGTSFLIDATVLNPDLLEAWRLLLDASLLTERPELAERALRAIVRLTPGDTTAKLERLWMSLESAPTLEAKVDLIERIIQPANIDVVTAPVASQLAFRLSLLQRRAGDPDAFWTWLQRSLALDPVNQEAVAMQAGVLHGAEQADPVVWTEILLELYRANPADTGVATELGLYLLNHGAYAAAARMLAIARDMETVGGGDPGSDLDADIALAHWGAGDIAAASEVLERRQRQLNALYQKASAGGPDEPRSSTIEVSSLIAPGGGGGGGGAGVGGRARARAPPPRGPPPCACC